MDKPSNLELLHRKRLALEAAERGFAQDVASKLSADGVRLLGFSHQDAMKGARAQVAKWAAWSQGEIQTIRRIVADMPGIATKELWAAYNSSRESRGMKAVGYSRFWRLVNSTNLYRYTSGNPGRAGHTGRWMLPMDSQAPTNAAVPA